MGPTYRLQHQKEAKHHAELTCSMDGHKKGSANYNKIYERAYRDYMSEISRSMSVSPNPMQVQENPSTPKIPKYLYDQFPFWRNDGFFDYYSKRQGLTKKDEKAIRQSFKSGIGNIVQVVLRLREGIRTKTKLSETMGGADELSEFQYVDFGDEIPRAERLNEMIQIEINRYVRMFIATLLLYHLETIFQKGADKEFHQVFDNADKLNIDLSKPNFIYDQRPFWKAGGFFDYYSKERKLNKAQQKGIREQFKSGIGNLSTVILKLIGERGLQITTYGEQQTVEGDKEKLSEIHKNFEIRKRIISSIILQHLTDILDLTNKEKIASVLPRSGLLAKDPKTGKITFNSIKNKDARINFIQRILFLQRKALKRPKAS